MWLLSFRIQQRLLFFSGRLFATLHATLLSMILHTVANQSINQETLSVKLPHAHAHPHIVLSKHDLDLRITNNCIQTLQTYKQQLLVDTQHH